MNRTSETPFERRERLDLESALLLSTQQVDENKSRLARLPSLHGTLDNSSYSDTSLGTGTGTTDEIASFGPPPPPRPQPEVHPTPLSEIDSFGSGREMSGMGMQVEQGKQASVAEDDDEVIGDSEGEEREAVLDPHEHHNNTGASLSSIGPSTSSLARAVAPPAYDWSEPSTTSSLASAAFAVAVAVAPSAQPPTAKKPHASPFAIVVPSTTKARKAKSSKAPVELSKEFVDSDDDDSAPPVKKRPAAADDDEKELTDYDELPSLKPPKKKARRASSAAAPSSDPLAAFDARQSRSRSRSVSLSEAPVAKPKGKRAPTVAISSNGEGTAEVLRHVQEREAREAEDDDDFGAPPAKKKKPAPKKKKEPKEKKEPKPRKPTKAQLQKLEQERLQSVTEDVAMPAAAPQPSPERAAELVVRPGSHGLAAEPAPQPAPAVQPAETAPSSQPMTTATSSRNKKLVVADSEDEASPSAPVHPALAIADDADDEEDVPAPVPAKRAPVKRVNKGKGKAAVVDSSASESEELPQPKEAPGKDKAEVARRIEAVMAAALADEDALGLASGSGSGPSRKSNEENVAPRTAVAGTPAASGFAKARLAVRSGSAAPSSSAKKGLAGVMEKKALWGHRAPGLSSRVKVPRLHTNLKPPPPAKPPVPKEKARVKKGHEVYSDEDKPWYETKHPEEWDSDDREKFKKVQKRREMGFDSD